MSSWGDLQSQLYLTDRTIIHKLETLLINQECNEAYLEHGSPCLLDDPLTFIKTEDYDFKAIPLNALLDIIEVLKQERNDLASQFIRINNERKLLRQQNLKLMERLFAFENFKIENLDKDFNQFLSKSFFINYELTKLFLQKERKMVEDLQRVIQQKNTELSRSKLENQALEKKVIEAREKWKLSIMETPTGKSVLGSALSTKESTADSKNKSLSSHMKIKPDLKLDEVDSELADLHASINDKVEKKIRALQSERSESAIFDDDFDLNTSRARTSTNKDYSLRIVNTWEEIGMPELSPLTARNNRITFGVDESTPIHHQHTKTPIFLPNPNVNSNTRNFSKPTESTIQKFKDKPATTITTNKPNSRTMSKAQISKPEPLKKLLDKNIEKPMVGSKTTMAKTQQQIRIPTESDRDKNSISYYNDDDDRNECNVSVFSAHSIVKAMGEKNGKNELKTPFDSRRPSEQPPVAKLEHSKSSAIIGKRPTIQNGGVTPLRTRPVQTPRAQASKKYSTQIPPSRSISIQMASLQQNNS